MRLSGADVVQIAVPLVWLGMVLAISFLETPLRFRAPGITVPLALRVGRLVFRALAIVEVALAGVLTTALLFGDRISTVIVLASLLWVVLVVQVAVLLPRLDRRARSILAGGSPPHSRLHLAYVALDGVKVVLLPVLGVVLVREPRREPDTRPHRRSGGRLGGRWPSCTGGSSPATFSTRPSPTSSGWTSQYTCR